MADEEHLALLRESVEQWNAWRLSTRYIEVDLNGVDLSDANLTGVKFSKTHLNHAQLVGVTAEPGDFDEAHLTYADLTNAKLVSASFRGANMAHAILKDATLRLGHFNNAELNQADLRGADLSFATFERTRIEGIKIDRRTTLDTLRIENLDPLFREHEQTIEISPGDKWLNWGWLRIHRTLPALWRFVDGACGLAGWREFNWTTQQQTVVGLHRLPDSDSPSHDMDPD